MFKHAHHIITTGIHSNSHKVRLSGIQGASRARATKERRTTEMPEKRVYD
jgi:hypothetical protein